MVLTVHDGARFNGRVSGNCLSWGCEAIEAAHRKAPIISTSGHDDVLVYFLLPALVFRGN